MEIQYTKGPMVCVFGRGGGGGGWGGGQFQRLIDLTKHSLYKSIGRTQLTCNELEEILHDVEINLNNGPLTYVEDDIQLNVLPPNSMILGRDVRTINSTADGDPDKRTKKDKDT